MTSDEFRTLRLQLGLTQAELGKIMGMRPQEISRIESVRATPTKIQAAFIRYVFDQKSAQK